MSLVAICSAEFPGRYLSLEAFDVDRPSWPGGGKVTTNTFIDTCETFVLHNHRDGSVSFESFAWPGVFLRLDGNGVSEGFSSAGGGTVNAQYGCMLWERFHIRRKETPREQQVGIVGIESKVFRNRFIRVTPDVVNVQGQFTSYEELHILTIG